MPYYLCWNESRLAIFVSSGADVAQCTRAETKIRSSREATGIKLLLLSVSAHTHAHSHVNCVTRLKRNHVLFQDAAPASARNDLTTVNVASRSSSCIIIQMTAREVSLIHLLSVTHRIIIQMTVREVDPFARSRAHSHSVSLF